MSDIADSQQVYALRYGTRDSNKSQEFFRYDVYQCPDEPLRMDYFFWLIRRGDNTILVDCGFDEERGLTKKRVQETSPSELLTRTGVSLGDVNYLIVTHMHYDHVGNVALFPNATVVMAKQEYDFWTGPYGDREVMRSIVFPEELSLIQEIDRQGRLRLVSDATEIVTGVTVTPLGGHTAGQAIVEVRCGAQTIVLASDAAHFLEEIELGRPFKLYDDIGAMYGALDILRGLMSQPNTTVIAGHDPRVADMFQEVHLNCFDLTSPSDGG